MCPIVDKIVNRNRPRDDPTLMGKGFREFGAILNKKGKCKMEYFNGELGYVQK
jgi:hypothetical protein